MSKITGVILVAVPIINLSRMDVTHPNYGLTNSIEEALAPDISISPLPRAVLRPNSYVLLDGEWNFALDLEDKGCQELWYVEHHYEHKAQWPGSIEEHMAAAKDTLPENQTWHDKVIAWYEREFPLPVKLEDGIPDSIL